MGGWRCNGGRRACFFSTRVEDRFAISMEGDLLGAVGLDVVLRRDIECLWTRQVDEVLLG